MNNQELAQFLELHRKHTLDALGDGPGIVVEEAVAHAHDRATTKTLLDLLRGGQASTPSTSKAASASEPAARPSRQVKAGSKRAKERAQKAQQTRRENLARKAQEGAGAVPVTTVVMNTPRTTTSGAAGVPRLTPPPSASGAAGPDGAA